MGSERSRPRLGSAKENAMKFNPDTWARTVPHSWFSRWPDAARTKCDFCGVYRKDHPADVPDIDDVARHPISALKRHKARSGASI
jgi:hypothetical protein